VQKQILFLSLLIGIYCGAESIHSNFHNKYPLPLAILGTPERKTPAVRRAGTTLVTIYVWPAFK
jgi:hypothetical protein